MFSPATESRCRLAIQAEYHKAKKEHRDFGSLHEGWAVMREEWEEAFRELSAAAGEMNEMWEHVKQDDVACSLNAARNIQTHATGRHDGGRSAGGDGRKMMNYCKSQMHKAQKGRKTRKWYS